MNILIYCTDQNCLQQLGAQASRIVDGHVRLVADATSFMKTSEDTNVDFLLFGAMDALDLSVLKTSLTYMNANRENPVKVMGVCKGRELHTKLMVNGADTILYTHCFDEYFEDQTRGLIPGVAFSDGEGSEDFAIDVRDNILFRGRRLRLNPPERAILLGVLENEGAVDTSELLEFISMRLQSPISFEQMSFMVNRKLRPELLEQTNRQFGVVIDGGLVRISFPEENIRPKPLMLVHPVLK